MHGHAMINAALPVCAIHDCSPSRTVQVPRHALMQMQLPNAIAGLMSNEDAGVAATAREMGSTMLQHAKDHNAAIEASGLIADSLGRDKGVKRQRCE